MAKNESWSVGATRVILLLAFIGGAAYCINQFAVDTLTTKESTLLGIVLTVFSTLASWMVTHIYAASEARTAISEVQERSRENLRTYALKAAEKVNNLSNELNKLSSYLEEELSYTDYGSANEALSAKEERIESAIHMIRMLKSVNDTSLSDWKGVIGEELNQQREERIEKVVEVQDVIAEMEDLLEHQRQDTQGSQQAETLRSEFRTLRQDLRSALLDLGLTGKIPTKVERKGKKQTVQSKCPVCGAPVSITQNTRDGSMKAASCSACGTKLISRFSEAQGISLSVRIPVEETFACSKCGSECKAELDLLPSATAVAACPQCNASLQLVRNPSKILVRDASADPKKYPKHPPAQKLSEQLIALVSEKVPKQPWETGMHLKVGQELGLPPALVSKVIQEQIRRQVFLPQVEGVVYEPKSPDVGNQPSSGGGAG